MQKGRIYLKRKHCLPPNGSLDYKIQKLKDFTPNDNESSVATAQVE